MKSNGWLKGLTSSALILSMVFAAIGCANNKEPASSAAPSGGTTPAETKAVTLKMAMYDSSDDNITFLQNKVKEYSTIKPNVTVELEAFKSDGDYLQAMKVRMAANELPDILHVKSTSLTDFKNELEPLNDMPFIDKNIYASKYAVDGKILAVPSVSFPELVYYHPSIFQELGLTVPTTWPQFMEVLGKIKDSGKYIPYAMGGKDGWPNYPFAEFMPHLESGKETYLSDIAKEDQPFAEGTPFYKAYSKIDEMFKMNVMGPDPLGVSWDQAADLFANKKAAVLASGLWYLPQYQTKGGSMEDLAAFAMPYRSDETTPLKIMTLVEGFYGLNKNSKKLDEAKDFLNWFYSPAVYQTYIDNFQQISTFDGVTSNVPFMNEFYKNNKVEAFTYMPGDEAYTRKSNAIQLDWKKMGQEMMSGVKLTDIAKNANDKWENAK